MDVDNNLSETEVYSALVDKTIYGSSVDLNKKRKLEDDQVDLPSPKHKCGDPASEQGGGVSEDGTRRLESPSGSNYFNFATAMSSYPDPKLEPNFLKVYTYNKPAKFENVYPKTQIYDQPSTSYGSCGSNSFKSTDETGTSVREGNSTINKEFGGEILKDGVRFEENELPGFEKYTDCINSEYETMEECPIMEDNDMNLDPNEAESNLFVLSSGRWDIDPDSRVDSRKPTIDQEFEQYFSMLML
ncbi:hypothetical protein MKW98_018481 [Papaver atlanticum]|uniref:Uncharacterized protein n=1 Tax=Papaver atlanticum TaxID=357466 RepID=A0AAD4TG61_9MAGN|nr:hypothetical protein MKW98_018481 [Papaver atlanticum]